MTVGQALLLGVGNHLAGLARHDELRAHGARLVGQVHTAPDHRLLARGDAPPFNPALGEVGAGQGSPIAGELYALPAAAIASLADLVRAPIRLSRVRLADGREVHGYLCDGAAAAGARDITHLGGWRAFLAQGRRWIRRGRGGMAAA